MEDGEKEKRRRGRGELEKRERSGSRAVERDCPSMVPSGICSAMQGRKRRRLICLGLGWKVTPLSSTSVLLD